MVPASTACLVRVPIQRRRRSLRSGFTAIELLVVIGIMMAVMAMAMPSVMNSLRRGKVSSAATDIMQCWRQARNMALMRSMPDAPNGTVPKHYGMMLVQHAGQQCYAALIYDNQAAANISSTPEASVLRADPTSGSTSDAVNPPVAKYVFNRNVVLASADTPAQQPDTHDRVLVVYAQYRTGLPISPEVVVDGKAPNASAIGVGLADNPTFGLVAGTISAQMRLQTLDYTLGTVKRGYAVGVTLYPIGVVATQEL